MPVDTSWVGAQQPYQPPDVVRTLAGFQNLALQQENSAALREQRLASAQERQQKAEAERRGLADQSALDQAAQPGLTLDQVLAQLPGHMHTAVRKQWADADKAQSDAQDAKAKAAAAEADYYGSLAASVNAYAKDGPEAMANAAQIALAHAKAGGHDTSQIEQMLQQNPAALPQVINSLIQASPKQRELARQEQEANTTTRRLDLEAPGIAADTAVKQQVAAGTVGGLTPDQQARVANDKALRRQADDAARVAWAKFSEEQRHNKATEAQGDPNNPKTQERLEQQYRGVLQRTMSSRSGGLGLEDQKVNQAIHLMAIFDQNRDPKTGEFNIPTVLQNELALGLARLTSPTGQVGAQLADEMNQRTAKGDLAGALTYITGKPLSGSTQDIFKMFRDSIERQGQVAQANRETYLNSIRAMAPTDLADDRRQQIEKSLSLNTLGGPAGPAAGGPQQRPIPGIPGGVAELRDGKWIRIK